MSGAQVVHEDNDWGITLAGDDDEDDAGDGAAAVDDVQLEEKEKLADGISFKFDQEKVR